ncbi:hypothetical protein BKA61DRAFT_665443 [Leptodontidium sp. MPI-SDFR-AT-0119]|nr:hypothetical protein BKA61DRAFT_665443 [Leptodontidium sp. MPI-SDFR-AT-0119]
MENQRSVYVKNNIRNRIVKLIVVLLAMVVCYDTWHSLFSSSSDSTSHYHDTGNDKEASMSHHHHHHQMPQEAGGPCSCGGGSVETAQAMGCVFDVLASACLPPWCRDSELTHEFNHAGPGADGEWTFYKDTDGNETMTLDELGELGNHPGKPWFSTYEWHVLHCVYNWRKMFRACTLGTTLEPFTTMRCISCIVGR